MRINYIAVFGGMVGFTSDCASASALIGFHSPRVDPLRADLPAALEGDGGGLDPFHESTLFSWLKAYDENPDNDETARIVRVLDALWAGDRIKQKCLIELFVRIPHDLKGAVGSTSYEILDITDLEFLEALDRAMRWSNTDSDWELILADIAAWNESDPDQRTAILKGLRDIHTRALFRTDALINEREAAAGDLAVRAGVPVDRIADYEKILHYAKAHGGLAEYQPARIGLVDFPEYISPIAALVSTVTPQDWTQIVEKLQAVRRSRAGSEDRTRSAAKLNQLISQISTASGRAQVDI